MKNNGIVFTDGACLGNPGPGGWGAIVFIPGVDGGEIRELGGSEELTTNNRMEIMAGIKALEFIDSLSATTFDRLKIYADSKYVIQGATQWIWGWKKNGWISKTEGTEVKNKDLWLKLDGLLARLSKKFKIDWEYVAGHSGNPGNDRCDEIAVAFAKQGQFTLYDGEARGYSVDLDPGLSSGVAKKKKSKTTATTYYLSLVGGQVYRDKSWSECESRVKGHRGVRFKKCNSSEEEAEILRGWGFKGAL